MYGFCERNLFHLTLRRYFLRLTEVLLWRGSKWTADEPCKGIQSKHTSCHLSVFSTQEHHIQAPKFEMYAHYMLVYNTIIHSSWFFFVI